MEILGIKMKLKVQHTKIKKKIGKDVTKLSDKYLLNSMIRIKQEDDEYKCDTNLIYKLLLQHNNLEEVNRKLLQNNNSRSRKYLEATKWKLVKET